MYLTETHPNLMKVVQLRHELTPNVKAGTSQYVSLVVVTDEVVTRCLLRGVQASQRHAKVAWTQHSVEGPGELLSVQSPKQRTGMDAKVGVDPAAGCQVGPHVKHGVLGVDNCYIWGRKDS